MTTVTKQSEAGKAQQAYVEKELKKLIGGKVIAVGAVLEDDLGWPEVWPVFHLLLPNGEKLAITVSRDEEGNGPGHLFIEGI
jgi:hypothetical protein